MNRSDVIVTVCVLASLLLAVVSCAIAFAAGPAWACLSFSAACFLVLLAMFVTMYMGNGS